MFNSRFMQLLTVILSFVAVLFVLAFDVSAEAGGGSCTGNCLNGGGSCTCSGDLCNCTAGNCVKGRSTDAKCSCAIPVCSTSASCCASLPE